MFFHTFNSFFVLLTILTKIQGTLEVFCCLIMAETRLRLRSLGWGEGAKAVAMLVIL